MKYVDALDLDCTIHEESRHFADFQEAKADLGERLARNIKTLEGKLAKLKRIQDHIVSRGMPFTYFDERGEGASIYKIKEGE